MSHWKIKSPVMGCMGDNTCDYRDLRKKTVYIDYREIAHIFAFMGTGMTGKSWIINFFGASEEKVSEGVFVHHKVKINFTCFLIIILFHQQSP